MKVDQSFVAHVPDDEASRAIVQGITEMAHALGRRVVAEGVETLRVRSAVERIGCDLLQGYVIARPLPPERVLAYFAA